MPKVSVKVYREPAMTAFRRRNTWIPGLLLTLTVTLSMSGQTSPTTQAPAAQTGAARAVIRVGMTVDDADRSIDFYTRVLDFQKISDSEVAGKEVEQLEDVFGARCRIV